MTDYEVTVIGGGPAGLTTALYTTRLGHDTKVYNRGGGRCAMMADTHNVIGITEDTSGMEFLQTAIEQVKSYGADYEQAYVQDVSKVENGFKIFTGDGSVTAEKVVLATGFSDGHPPSPAPRTARGLHYCLHCDAYMFIDEPVYVMGNGESAAHVSMIMLNFTDDVDLLLRGEEPEWSEETDRQLRAHPVDIIETEVTEIENEDGWLKYIGFEDGEIREYKGGFAMYGSDYNNELAQSLGCELVDGGEIVVDDHGCTTVEGVYAVGDVTEGHNQIPVRMGQGAKAGIDIHYNLREYPESIKEIESAEELSVPAISSDLRNKAKEHSD
jgi:thioredoxin reductase (NADPH)